MIIETIPLETLISLPRPKLGNAHAQTSSVVVKRMMDSSVSTYTNKRAFKTFRYQFLLTRAKGLEVLEFMKIYAGSKLKITRDDATTLIVNFLVNPTELEMQRRAVAQNSVEDIDLELVFEEVE